MRKLAAFLLCSLPVYVQAQLPFKLRGKIGTMHAPAKMILSYVDSSDNVITDSAILSNGQFYFSGRIAYPTRASLELYRQGERDRSGQPDIMTLYLDGDPISVASKDSVKNAVVRGSQLNRQYSNLLAALRPFNKQFAALSDANARYATEKGDANAVMPGMKERWAAVANQKKAVVAKFIADHPGSYLSLEMLPTVLSLPYKAEELEAAFKALAPAVRNTPPGKKLAERIVALKTIGVGSPAPDFVQKDTSGIPIKLSSFRGQYVLIDFWASWCHPCRLENPGLVKCFLKYKGRNFTVLGVSLDRPNDREKWLTAIHDDGLAWTNVSDLAFWNNAAARLYGVHSIPHNYLVDPSGMIIAQNLHGEALDRKLEEVLAAAPARAAVRTKASARAAVDSLVEVIESHKDSINALRGYLVAMGGATDEAVAQFNTWMKKFPASPSFPYVLGEAYYKQRMRMKVIENWLKVLEMNQRFEKIEKLWPIVVKSDWDLDIPVTSNTIDSLKRLIVAHPDSLLPIRQYVFVAGDDEEATVRQLEAWEKQFPSSAAIPLAMALKLYNVESPKATTWLQKAAALQPGNAPIWVMLHLDAERWGDKIAAHEYMGKASAAAPEDPNYAYYYARYYEDTDTSVWRTKIYELVKRFPNDERGAEGLYEIAVHAGDTAEKIKELEQLRRLYDPHHFWWSKTGMSVLFDTYIEAGQTAKAKELAVAMGTDDEWGLRQSLADGLEEVNVLLKGKNYLEALKRLTQLKAPRSSTLANGLVVLKATVLQENGQTQAAYDSLIAVESASPDDKIRSALAGPGAALKKSHDDVEKDIWQAREKFIRQAPPFELGLYTSDKKAALADYKGKVVLLTFWFPGCGPCRAEFPHFENVLKKFKGKDVAYLAINVSPLQDDYVLPFLQGTDYSFTPLRGNAEWAAQQYHVSGEPANFLIDRDGRIVFSDFLIEQHNERMLELMIASMLGKG